MTDQIPGSILEIVITEPDDTVALLGVCAGYEDGRWRYPQLVTDLVEWAIDWILTPDEQRGISHANAVQALGKALSRVYRTEKYRKRGEIGELLLHIILRRFLNSNRVISRIFFKDASNDTVKGFDAVHVVDSAGQSEDEFQLWLGESKFYTDSREATVAVIDELKTHLQTDYLRAEFSAITDKMPSGIPREEQIKKLLDRKTSLDAVFSSVVIPVFITFDSSTTGAHAEWSDAYVDAIREELRREWQVFIERLGKVNLPRKVRVHLILLPMATKEHLVDEFDERLKAWQVITKI